MSRDEYTLDGAIVITGGGSGIGRAVALASAERGAGVAVLDLNGEAANDAAEEARSRGAGTTLGIQCDVRDEDSVSKAINDTTERIGPIRGVVTCAGIATGGLAHELSTATWDEVLSTNLTGTFLACKHVLMRMLDQGAGGSIVCASSPMSDVSVPGGASAYCASKGGISAFVRSLAIDYAQHSIRVNAIVPGATETPLMWGDLPSAEIPGAREEVRARVALGRLAEPNEVAAAIVWLLSDDASYVTGSHLVVDGGLLARASIDV